MTASMCVSASDARAETSDAISRSISMASSRIYSRRSSAIWSFRERAVWSFRPRRRSVRSAPPRCSVDVLERGRELETTLLDFLLDRAEALLNGVELGGGEDAGFLQHARVGDRAPYILAVEARVVVMDADIRSVMSDEASANRPPQGFFVFASVFFFIDCIRSPSRMGREFP